jgi:hypothetical protein
MKLLPIFLLLILVLTCSIAGCVSYNEIVVVQDRCQSSINLEKGLVYNVDLWIKNEGSSSQNVQVTVDLISSSTGQIRDESTQIVNLQSTETKQLRFTLDGEEGVQYQYKYYTKSL